MAALNYVGALPLLDRGDAPAQAVLDRNARSLSERVAMETKEELAKVLDRVENVYNSYENSSAFTTKSNNADTNMEYVNDLAELEELLRDQIKKKKYQQQITVFIVGYEVVCGQKLRLLQQVNEFFMENSNKIATEDEDMEDSESPQIQGIDLDDVAECVEDTLRTAEMLTTRLNDINKDIVEYLINYANTKSNSKGKKKLEKALTQAKDEITALTEKLLALQAEIAEREEKLQQMNKQLETKTQEAQRYKTAAEVAKRGNEEAEILRTQLAQQQGDMAALSEHLKTVNAEMEFVQQQLQERENAVNSNPNGYSDQEDAASNNELPSDNEDEPANEDTESLNELHDQNGLLAEVSDIGFAKTMSTISNLQTKNDAPEEDNEEVEQTEDNEGDDVHEDDDLGSDTEVKSVYEVLTVNRDGTQEHVYMYFEDEDPGDDDTNQTDKTMLFDDTTGVNETETLDRDDDAMSTPVMGSVAPNSQTFNGDSQPSHSRESSPYRRVSMTETVYLQALEKRHDEIVSNLKESHQLEMQAILIRHENQVEGLTEEKRRLELQNETLMEALQGQKKAQRKGKKKASSKSDKEDSDGEEDGEVENNTEFDDEGFALEDEDAWGSVSNSDVFGRFGQYRQLALKRITELEELIEDENKKTYRKINTLKGQFQEHKTKWDSERSLLIDEIKQSSSLQAAAETEADRAITQLEDFINDQELLEANEIEKRTHLSERELSSANTLSNLKEAAKTLDSAVSQPENLMDQTDDAKAAMGQSNPDGEEDERGDQSSSQKPRSSLKSADSQLKPRSVTFSSDLPKKSGGYPSLQEHQNSLSSIAHMLSDENTLTDKQQQALNVLRCAMFGAPDDLESNSTNSAWKSKLLEEDARSMLIYTLLSHLAHNSVLLGLHPTGLLRACAKLIKESLHEKFNEEDMMFLMEDTPLVDSKDLKQIWIRTDDSQIKADTDADDEGLRSSHSRASLRSAQKAKLEELRSARRSRASTAIRASSASDMLSEAQLDENADIPFPPDEPVYLDRGTSAMTPPLPAHLADSQRDPATPAPTAITNRFNPMADHPIVEEYLRGYDGVVNFKENLSQIFIDKEMMSAGQVLADISPIELQRDEKVQPQMERMTNNVLSILEEAMRLVNDLLENARDYPVSSLDASREPTRIAQTADHMARESVTGSPTGGSRGVTPQKSSRRSRSSKSMPGSAKLASVHEDKPQEDSQTTKELGALQVKHKEIQAELSNSTMKYEQKLENNNMMMLEMQETIQSLQMEMAALARQQQMQQEQANQADAPVMFTRLDSERNAKVLKKAVMEDRIAPDKFEEIVTTMDEYISLPARRLVHLVHKYVHHCKMRKIEDNVRQSTSLSGPVYMTLDKMEAFQNKRAQRWAEEMDTLGMERLKLAAYLMQTLEDIERQSGIFLIKPMYSYKGSFNPDTYNGKLSRPYRPPREFTSLQQMNLQNIGTPRDSHSRAMRYVQSGHGGHHTQSSLAFAGDLVDGDSRPMWNPGQALSNPLEDNKVPMGSSSYLNTPRLLELDINRMLIGQNQISLKLNPTGLEDIKASTSVRNYITVSRPTGQLDRQGTAPDGILSHSAPPTTPMRGDITPRGAQTDRRLSKRDSAPILPPINGASRDGSEAEPPLPPHSPPGSSLRHTPPTHMRSRPPTGASHVSAVSIEVV